MFVSVRVNPSTAYPSGEHFFSPSERFPEYPFEDLGSGTNQVYGLVRSCLFQAGLDAANFGKPEWNPFAGLVRRGSTAFVLCNFVYHRRRSETPDYFQAKCTHASVIRALADYLLIATGKNGRILIGNAAIPTCNWDRVLRDTGTNLLFDFYRQRNCPVELRDLRFAREVRDSLGRVIRTETDCHDRGVLVELGCDSLLAPLTGTKAFRVSEYNPDCTDRFHRATSHRYVIHRDALDADVILSVPKLKTHHKVGLTCALKGTVGTVARKDCLAHHRFGSVAEGGDEYEADPIGLRRLQSRFHDYVYRQVPEAWWGNGLRVLDTNLRRLTRRLGWLGPGAWWGNDTAWRMALDVARIVAYGSSLGGMADRALRPHWVLVDGVVAGEGNGPLNPEPKQSGVLLLADNPVAADLGCARLAGFPLQSLPLVREALELHRYPLWDPDDDLRVFVNGQEDSLNGLEGLCDPLLPPPGWIGKLGEPPQGTT